MDNVEYGSARFEHILEQLRRDIERYMPSNLSLIEKIRFVSEDINYWLVELDKLENQHEPS